jgi:hypothetical protein
MLTDRRRVLRLTLEMDDLLLNNMQFFGLENTAGSFFTFHHERCLSVMIDRGDTKSGFWN